MPLGHPLKRDINGLSGVVVVVDGRTSGTLLSTLRQTSVRNSSMRSRGSNLHRSMILGGRPVTMILFCEDMGVWYVMPQAAK